MGSAPGNLDRRAPCYGVADLRIGASIDVHGRIFFLHDCDDFTRRCVLQLPTEPANYLRSGRAPRHSAAWNPLMLQ